MENTLKKAMTLGLVFGVLGAVALIAANAIGHDVAAMAPKSK